MNAEIPDPRTLSYPVATFVGMDWIDEPGGEERWDDWCLLFDEFSTTVESLDTRFSRNELDDVVVLGESLVTEASAIFEHAGVLFLTTDPVIESLADLDLDRRHEDDPELLDEDDVHWVTYQRSSSTSFESIARHASIVCADADRAVCRVAGEVEDYGWPTVTSLFDLADAAVLLAEWVVIYVEAAIGRHRATGFLPDTGFGGGHLSEQLDWERAGELPAAIGADPAI